MLSRPEAPSPGPIYPQQTALGGGALLPHLPQGGQGEGAGTAWVVPVPCKQPGSRSSRWQMAQGLLWGRASESRGLHSHGAGMEEANCR